MLDFYKIANRLKSEIYHQKKGYTGFKFPQKKNYSLMSACLFTQEFPI